MDIRAIFNFIALKKMALTEDLFIYKDTRVLCKILLKYRKTVSKIVRYSTYNEAVNKT